MLILFISLFVLVSSAPQGSLPIASFPGECPSIGAVNGFDIQKWASGAWHQIYVEASDKIHWNDEQTCVERRYTNEDKELNIEKYYVTKQKPVWKNSKIVLTDTPGVFNHMPMENATKWYKNTQIYIVDTDYDNYCVAWGCVYDEESNTRLETAGISSRTNSLSKEKLEEISSFFKNKGSEIRFIPVDWSDCRVKCE
uniref:Lipocalin/cytosolic fatty-acid binding domain-containing protein n=1 Tax=Strigamia maritima TaxID=126957 RepID=T1J6W5_STRMM